MNKKLLIGLLAVVVVGCGLFIFGNKEDYSSYAGKVYVHEFKPSDGKGSILYNSITFEKDKLTIYGDFDVDLEKAKKQGVNETEAMQATIGPETLEYKNPTLDKKNKVIKADGLDGEIKIVDSSTLSYKDLEYKLNK